MKRNNMGGSMLKTTRGFTLVAPSEVTAIGAPYQDSMSVALYGTGADWYRTLHLRSGGSISIRKEDADEIEAEIEACLSAFRADYVGELRKGPADADCG